LVLPKEQIRAADGFIDGTTIASGEHIRKTSKTSTEIIVVKYQVPDSD
jgi:hypothetical protein